MISYDGVIRKRLRLKGHPEIPPYKPSPNQQQDAGPSSEQTAIDTPPQTRQQPPRDVEEDEITPIRPKVNDIASEERQTKHDDDEHDKESRVATEGEQQQDTRTEAEKRHDEIMLAREKEHVRKEASKSYREKVDDFNKRLAEEPDHYDLFKTSFTK